MLFSWWFKWFSEENDQRVILQELIQWLQINPLQKKLYLESLESLNLNELTILYEKLTDLVKEVEYQEIEKTYKEWERNRKNIQQQELKEKENEIKPVDIFFYQT